MHVIPVHRRCIVLLDVELYSRSETISHLQRLQLAKALHDNLIFDADGIGVECGTPRGRIQRHDVNARLGACRQL